MHRSKMSFNWRDTKHDTNLKRTGKVFVKNEVLMTVKGLLWEERTFHALLLQEQNEHKQASLIFQILRGGGGDHMTGAYGSWTSTAREVGPITKGGFCSR